MDPFWQIFPDPRIDEPSAPKLDFVYTKISFQTSLIARASFISTFAHLRTCAVVGHPHE